MIGLRVGTLPVMITWSSIAALIFIDLTTDAPADKPGQGTPLLIAIAAAALPAGLVMPRYLKVTCSVSGGTIDIVNPFRRVHLQLSDVSSYTFESRLGYDFASLKTRTRGRVRAIGWPFLEAARVLDQSGATLGS